MERNIEVGYFSLFHINMLVQLVIIEVQEEKPITVD